MQMTGRGLARLIAVGAREHEAITPEAGCGSMLGE